MSLANPANPQPWIVIPVHNRREFTLACLRHLHHTRVLAWMRTIVVDDGSTDGTLQAIRQEFPGVAFVRGDGNLWWTGAIAKGMHDAMQRGASHIFWLNDDTPPAAGALELLLQEVSQGGGIAGGVSYLPGEDAPAYGGYRRGFWRLRDGLDPKAQTISCDALNGNLVCMSREVVEQIGYPDGAGMPHGYGDFDYTLRASSRGISVRLVGTARAAAHPNLSTNYRSWLLSDVRLREVWRGLVRPGSFIFQPAMQRFYWRHFGVRGSAYCAWILTKLALITVIRLLVPVSVLRSLRGHRSRAWQHERRHAHHV
jgi:GT2 family glycosyltransferase